MYWFSWFTEKNQLKEKRKIIHDISDCTMMFGNICTQMWFRSATSIEPYYVKWVAVGCACKNVFSQNLWLVLNSHQWRKMFFSPPTATEINYSMLTRKTLTLHRQWVCVSHYPPRVWSSLLLMHQQSSDLDRNWWKRSIFISCKDDGNRSGMKFCIAIVETTFKRLFIVVFTVGRQSAFNLQAWRKQIN